jgi:hypothetical protein
VKDRSLKEKKETDISEENVKMRERRRITDKKERERNKEK